MNTRIKNFSEVGIKDVEIVGGKNASLGEMYNQLIPKGVKVSNGFATTSYAFWEFLKENKIETSLQNLLSKLDRKEYSNLATIGQQARNLILSGELSDAFMDEITRAYNELCVGHFCATAVRSSATAEDLPDASFAGQHDTFLNVKGEKPLLEAIKKCFASLFTNRAIKYREDKGFLHHTIAISVGVQLMVRADKGCSGVGFTIEPESGFSNVILLSGVWGLGENMVQGTVNPDEFFVFKPALSQNKYPIIQKRMGDKKLTMVYSETPNQSGTKNEITP